MAATTCKRCRTLITDFYPIKVDGETFCSYRCMEIHDSGGGAALAVVALVFASLVLGLNLLQYFT